MSPWLFWLTTGLVALMVGITKTGVPGISTLMVLLLALVFPGQERLSVGVMLPLLIFGDVFAVFYYKRHAQWPRLWRLLPWVLPGMGAAALVLNRISDAQLKHGLGFLVLILLGMEVARRRGAFADVPNKWWFAALMGFLAGFTTTLGNAAGPVMGIYLLSMGMPKEQFMGTGAWYFCIVNWLKVPVFAALGMLNAETLMVDLKLLPLVAIGAIVGAKILPKISEKAFSAIVLGLAGVAAAHMAFVPQRRPDPPPAVESLTPDETPASATSEPPEATDEAHRTNAVD